ncbi:hypothetical protein DYB31_015679, partial [Aphanomyces astaci]
PVDVLKTIIEYKVLDFNARYLSTPFVKARSAFYDMVIEGLKELPSRATICRYQVETSIGELLGTYYPKEVWTADIAACAELLVLALKAAFKTGLESAGWLDDATRTNFQPPRAPHPLREILNLTPAAALYPSLTEHHLPTTLKVSQPPHTSQD